MNLDIESLKNDLESAKNLSNKLKEFLPKIKQSNEEVSCSLSNELYGESDYKIRPMEEISVDFEEENQIVMDVHMGVIDVDKDVEEKLVTMNDVTVVESNDVSNEEKGPLITEISSHEF